MGVVDQELVVKISGDGRGLTKSFSELEAQLKRFQTAFESATDPASIARLNKAIEATQGRMQALQKYTGTAAASLGSVSGYSDKAGQALNNLSRIAQDAPYGFIGISNNINPMLESFQRLKAESGSTSGALKAMAGSLTGAGGLGLAVGVVSSLLVVFGDKLFNSASATDLQKEAIDRLNASLEDSKNRYDDIIDSIKTAQALGDLNLKVNNQSPLLGLGAAQIDIAGKRNATNEQIDGINTQIDALTAKINKLKEAKEEQAKTPYIFRTESTQDDMAAEIERLQAQIPILEKARKDHYKRLDGIENEQSLTNAQIRLQKKEDRDKELKEQEEADKKAAEKRKATYDKALADYQRYVAAQKEAARKLKAAIDDAALNPDFSLIPPEDKPLDAKGNFVATYQELEERKNPNDLGFLPRDNKVLEALEKRAAEFKAKVLDLQRDIQASLQSFAADSIGTFGEAIGNALAGGSIEGVLKGFMSSIGQLMEDMGKMLISAAIKIQLAKEAFKSILANPALAISLGIGLIAIGAAVKSSVKPRPFAEGGIISGPTLGLMGEYSGAKNNPEVVAPLSKLKDMIGDTGGRVVIINSRIRGKDISLQAARQSKTRRRTA